MRRQQVADAYPLTPIQQGMLFHDILEPGAYLVQVHGVLAGELDVAAFESAWRRLLERHPILRTAFVWKQTPKPLQVVTRGVALPFALEDWSELGEEELAERRRRFLAEDRARGLDLARPPLMRITLARRGDAAWELVWTFHHLLLDGWSYPLLLEEALALYEALAAGQDPPPARERPPFRDYLAWLAERDLGAAEAFWRRRLAGLAAPTRLELGAASGEGHEALTLALGERLSSELTAFAGRWRLTPALIFEGTWARLLSLYSGDESVLFGSVGSGRPPSLPGVEEILGMFVSTLPVRADLDPGETVIEWLTRLRDEQLEARAFDFAPLSEIQKWSELAPGEPLFASCLSYQSYPLDAALGERGGSLACRDFDILEQPGFPLMLVVSPGRSLELKVEYRRSRFSAAAVGRLLRHLRRLLAALVADGGLRVGEWSPLGAAEKHQLLIEWSRGPRRELDAATVPQLIAERAAAAPDAVAAECAGEAMTYSELMARARRLARRLRRLGVGPERVVGICVGRSLDLPVALLGVLEAGGVCLPLDPTHPAGRLLWALDDAGARAVIASRELLDRLPELARDGRPALTVAGERAGELATADARPPAPVALSNLAYMVYTSGSTGRPKGVLIDHRSLLNYCRSMVRRFALEASDRVLQFASPGFNVLIEEVFPTLLAGATVVLHGNDLLLSLAELDRVLERERITVVELPAAFWQQWVADLEAREAAPPPTLRLLLLGCERPRRAALERWRRFGVRLVYVFGLTETTVTSSLFELPLDRPLGRRLPIGRPLGNTRLYVLDRELSPVPIGVVGELYVGGVGVGRGYRGRPRLTAERFVPDPWSRRGGRRLYRTGDRARYRSDGVLDFLGRLDHQLKIRGFRVEPGEIEARLEARPAVDRAVVAARPRSDGGQQLVAFVVAAGDGLDAPALRRELAAELPDYMIPARFALLDELPLSPNGKVDRTALPRLEPQAAGDEPQVAPRNEREELLATIWAQVLGLPSVGVEQNFFELGGDSILAIQIVARAARAGLGITVRQLFEQPTVAGLAAASAAGTAVEAEQGPVTGELPLTPAQRWFLAAPRGDRDHFALPVLLELERRWRRAPLERALGRLLAHHDLLRARFRREADGWRAEIPPPAVARVEVPVFDHRGLGSADRRRALRALGGELQASLDLEAGELLRAALIDRGDRLLLLIAAHHLVVDAVSWRILLEDLALAYRAEAAGGTPALPPKTTSFRRWAQRLVAWAEGAEARAEADYWLAEERSSAPRLPRDEPHGEVLERGARTHLVRLGAERTAELAERLPRAYRAGVHEALIAAVGRALADWCGGPALLEIEGHGRGELFDDVDLSRTVGWFTALYPLLLDLGRAAGPADDLVTAKEALRAVPADGIGHGALRWLASGELGERLAAQPRPEVLFNYVGRLDGEREEADAGLPFRLGTEDPGPASDPAAPRSHLLAVNAGLRGGELEIAWTYSPEAHRPATVEALADAALAALERLAAHCARPDAGALTPSDFPLARAALGRALDLAALDRLLAGSDAIDLYPLSPLQEGMLFHALYEDGAAQYVAQVLCELHGELDVERFHRSWSRVAERHPALRTAFRWEGLERPLQLVERRVELPLVTRDLRAEPEAEALAATLLDADRRRGFALDRAPLQRLTLLRLGERRWRMAWTFHQSTFDGWSLPVLLKDFLDAYEQGRAALAPPPPPYRDYVAWLERRDERDAESYWRRELEGFAVATPLPFDRPPGAAPRHRRRRLALGDALTAELRDFARRAQLTLNTLVQGGWALVLAETSGEHDVVFGGTVSGRPAELPGVEGMVGLFINTLPVRVRVEASRTALAWLRRLRDRQAEQRRYEHSALASVQRCSEVAAGEPLFDSFLAFQNYPMQPVLERGATPETGGLEVRDYRTDERPHFALSLVVHPVSDLVFELIYDAERFAPTTVERLLRHLVRWMRAMAQDPWARLGALSPLSAAERQQLLVEWAVPVPESAGAPAGWPVGEHLRRRARAHPEVAAVVWSDETLSYGELEARANRLAHHLIALGVRPDAPVALCVERSAELVVALVAILKAGGAYVPVADDYPRERQRYMLDDCGARVLVTDRGTVDRLPAFDGHTVVLGAIDDELAARPAHHPETAVHADCLAYVNYTSGSTGRPKAVGLTHRGVERLALTTNYADFRVGERMVQGASISFDAATYELWATLLAGATLVVLPREVTLSPPDLGRELERHAVENLFLTTALLHQVGREAPSILARLERVMFGGEAVEPRWIEAILERGAPRRLLHFYGPTENTTYSTWHPIDRVPPGASTLPIGRAVAHSTVYVVDRLGRPVPPGVPGELWVGGDGLARGYLGRPAATAERFIPDPFRARPADRPGGRLYRTGDLVRWNAEGALEFVGRADNQVKLRGFRIELGEIEAALLEHPAVADALVLLREDSPGDKRLAGYVAAGGQAAPAPGELREHLLERLPKFMVPAAFVVLDAFPLTANGKLDRRALPVPEVDRQALGAFIAPTGERQQALARIFAEVLRVTEVGADDNFFELGGDSILSIQLVSKAKAAGLRLTPRQLFEHPTVAELAAVADEGPAVDAEQETLEGELPLLPVVRAFLEHDPATRDHFNMPLLLRLDASLDPLLLERALAAVQRHHDALRLRLEPADEGWRQRYAPASEIAPLARYDLSALDRERRAVALEAIARAHQRGLDLARGPVLRAAHFALGEEARLLLVPHHLLVDGVSWRLLLEDLETAYRQLAAGEAIALPAKTTSLRAWAEALEELAAAGRSAEELDFWRGQQEADTVPLPLDDPRGDAAVGATETCTVALDRERTRQLVHEAPRAYRTELQELLLTAAALALTEWSGGPAVRFDLEGHGREEDLVEAADLSRTVGWFTTVYPVVIEPGDAADPGAALRAVKRQMRRIPQKGLGYGLSAHYNRRRGDGSRRRRAEVSFNYLGQLDQALPEGSLWAPAEEDVGEAVDPRRRREHALQIDAQILDDRLAVDWGYSRGQLRRETVEALAASFVGHLDRLIEHCQSPAAGEVTSEDFELADLDDEDLAAALDQVGFGEG